jgi:hypothetical protein
MVSTGGKTGVAKLGPLTLSAECLVRRYPQKLNTQSLPINTNKPDSYSQRLEREHQKVLGCPLGSDPEHPNRFFDPPIIPVLKLEVDQILETNLTKVQLWKNKDALDPIQDIAQNEAATPDNFYDSPDENLFSDQFDALPDTPYLPSKIADAPRNINVPTKTVAPRALPFSEETHVLVKIIAQDNVLNEAVKAPVETESIRWMQRDAVKHYLCIQDIENRRMETKGATYRSFQHDA